MGVTDWVLLVALVITDGLVRSLMQRHLKSELLGGSREDSLKVWGGFFCCCVLVLFPGGASTCTDMRGTVN